MPADVLETSFDDDFSDIDPGKVEAKAGPLTGSRGTTASSGSTATARPRGTRLAKKLDTLQKRLSGEMFTAGALIGMGLPVTGYYCCQESDAFTKAVIDLAADRPEWVEALEKLANIGPGLTVGRTVVGLGAALAVDRKRADPERQFMKFVGVYAAWKAVQDKKTPGEGMSDGNSYRPPPHVFQPV